MGGGIKEKRRKVDRRRGIKEERRKEGKGGEETWRDMEEMRVKRVYVYMTPTNCTLNN